MLWLHCFALAVIVEGGKTGLTVETVPDIRQKIQSHYQRKQ